MTVVVIIVVLCLVIMCKWIDCLSDLSMMTFELNLNSNNYYICVSLSKFIMEVQCARERSKIFRLTTPTFEDHACFRLTTPTFNSKHPRSLIKGKKN